MRKEIKRVTTIQGYGPAGLLEKVKGSKWSSCWGGGENFDVIGLFGYCLSRPSDASDRKYTVVMTEQGVRRRFKIKGFASRSIPVAATFWPSRRTTAVFGPLKIGNAVLEEERSKKKPKRYRITIQAD